MRENTMYENMIAVTNRQLYLQAAEKNRCRDGKKTRRCQSFSSWNPFMDQYLKQAEQMLSLSPKALVLREGRIWRPGVYRQLAKM